MAQYLDEHVRGMAPHPCALCPQRFLLESQLDQHVYLTHGGAWRYRERWLYVRQYPRPKGVHSGPISGLAPDGEGEPDGGAPEEIRPKRYTPQRYPVGGIITLCSTKSVNVTNGDVNRELFDVNLELTDMDSGVDGRDYL